MQGLKYNADSHKIYVDLKTGTDYSVTVGYSVISQMQLIHAGLILDPVPQTGTLLGLIQDQTISGVIKMSDAGAPTGTPI